MSASEPSSPAARACTSTLPSAVASTGPARTAAAEDVGGQPAQQLVARAAADDVHDVDLAAGRRARGARARGGTCTRARRGSSGRSRPASAGGSWPASRHAAAIRAGMSPGREEAVGVGVEQRRRRRAPRRARADAASSYAGASHCAPALLHEPQAHDVAQQAGRARRSPRSFVRLYARGALVEDRRVELERRAATTCPTTAPRRARRRAAGRRRTPTRCRGRRPRGPARRRAAAASAWWSSTGPSVVPGSVGSPANGAAGSPRRRDQLARPVAGARVEQAGRRGVRSPRWRARRSARGRTGPGTSAMRSAAASAGDALVGEQLEDRVDRHRLDAGDGVELRARDALVRARDHPVGAVVAVVERQAEHAVPAVEQRVVDAPGVDADAARARPRRPRAAARRAPR